MMPRKSPRSSRVAFHLVELGAGSATAAIRHKRRNPTHRVAAVDKVYGDRNLIRNPIPVIEKYSIHVFPNTYREFFKKMIAEGKRTPKIILDMPQQHFPVNIHTTNTSERIRRFEAQLRGVIRDLPLVLTPGGHLAITSERMDWMKMLRAFAREKGLVASHISEISGERARVQSETTRDMRTYTGYKIYRLVVSLPQPMKKENKIK